MPYFFAARVKADSDSGLTRMEKSKLREGTPQNFACLLQLVKLIKYKNISVREPLSKMRLLSSLGLPEEDNNA